MRRLLVVLSALVFLLGVGGLALTGYLWFGDWPQEMKAIVDHMRSARQNWDKAPEPLLQNPRGREHESLNGTWQAVVDPYGRGDLIGFAPRASAPKSPADLAEFSFEDGLTLEVPGDWNTQDPRLVFYQGVVWYKRTFEAVIVPGTQTYLYFGAANYRAAVYVNGLLVGVHEGGFTPFNFDVTEQLRAGENLLVVKVDNRRGAADIPTPVTDWHNYGGLTRDVLLVRVPETHVSAYGLRLEDEPVERIVGHLTVQGRHPSAQSVPSVAISVAIPELGVAITTRPDERGRATFTIPASPARWSPESPRLYRVVIGDGEQEIVDEIGFRTIGVSNGEILLNGEPIYLRGISIHDETLDGGGRAHSREHARATLGLAKELGSNFVRLAHYPHPEVMARVADRMGLLVWTELPVYWNVAFENEDTLERARRMASEVIDRDRNRASVVFWSLGNETPASPQRDRFFQSLAEHVRGRDSSRLLTAGLHADESSLARFVLRYYLPALLGWRRSEWIFPVDDNLARIVDVPAINQYFGWYYSGQLAIVTPFSSEYTRRIMLDNMSRIRLVTVDGKPLIVSELGAGAKAGLHAMPGEMRLYSEEYQAEVYRRQLGMLERQAVVRGMSPWVLKDFRAPLRLYQEVQDHWNRKGLVSETGEKKLAFGVLQDHYERLAARDQARMATTGEPD